MVAKTVAKKHGVKGLGLNCLARNKMWGLGVGI
jgi:hypothetical protein